MRYATFLLLISLCVIGVVHPDPFVSPKADDVPPAFGDIRQAS